MNKAAIAQQANTASVLPTTQGIFHRRCTCDNHVVGGECGSCQRKKGMLQRKSINIDSGIKVPSIVHEILDSPGQPLDAATRRFMEPRFGYDFSRVRIHANAAAAASAKAMDSMAFTVGNHLVLDHQLLPDRSYQREKVLAHELAHVVQQSNVAPPDNITLTHDSALEAQADAAAQQVMRGHSVRVGIVNTTGLMRIPRSLSSSVNPQTMASDAIQREIEEINRYLEMMVLSPDTIDHLDQMREQLVVEQRRRSGREVGPQSRTEIPARVQSRPPFFGLQPADSAVRGVSPFFLAETELPHTDRTEHTFRRGPYLIALNEVLLPDGSRRISFYVAHRLPGPGVGDRGWNEYIVGPGSIEDFLSNLSTYSDQAALAYRFGPPAPHEAAAGRMVSHFLQGEFGEAVDEFGNSWLEAFQDPSWWLEALIATGAAVTGASAPARPRPSRPPRLRAVGGGRGPVRSTGHAGPRRVAGPLRSTGTAAERSAVRASTPFEQGSHAREIAPILDPALTSQPRLAAVPSLQSALPAQPGPAGPISIAPIAGAVGLLAARATRPHEYEQFHGMTREQFETARRQRRPTAVPPLIPGIDYDEEPEEAARRDPCDLLPFMEKCSNLESHYRHGDQQSAFEEARNRFPRERQNGPWRSTGDETSVEIAAGTHTTWWSQDGRNKITVGCVTCCEAVMIEGFGASAVERTRCAVLNTESY